MFLNECNLLFLLLQTPCIKYISSFRSYSSDVTKMIEDQTGIAQSNQLILLKDLHWLEYEKFPTTDIDNPLFLFNRENNNVTYTKDIGSCMLILNV